MIRHFLPAGRKHLSNISHRLIPPKDIPRILFKKGENFQGTILRVLDNGQVVISAKGRIFSAQAKGPLTRGCAYEFIVVRTRPYIELKVISKGMGHEESVLRLWAETESGRKMFGSMLKEILELVGSSRALMTKFSTEVKDLSTVLNTLVYTRSTPREGHWIFESLLSSGLFFENKLSRFARGQNSQNHTITGKDLKGILLRMFQGLESDDGKTKEVSSLIQKVTNLIHLIEGQQAINLECLKNEIGWVWFIPIQNDDNSLGSAELLAKKSSNNNFVVWMNLNMSRLGHAKVLLTLTGDKVGVTFFLGDEEKRKLAYEKANVLREGMVAKGLFLEGFSSEVGWCDELAYRLGANSGAEGVDLEV